MGEPGALAALSAAERAQGLPLRTLQRWTARYRQHGLAGLVRQRRGDRHRRRLPPELQHLIEGLVLQKSRPTIAAVHREVAELAPPQGWPVPSYRCVYEIVRTLAPALRTLAHEGNRAYQNAYDLVHRRQASQPNAIWQADHSPLDIYLLNEPVPPPRRRG